MLKRMKNWKAKIKEQAGFTLIELMATLGILALITMIAVPAIGTIMQKAEEQANDASIAMIEDSATIAELGGLEGAVEDAFTTEELVTGGYLKLSVEDDLHGEDHVVTKNADGTYTYSGPSGD